MNPVAKELTFGAAVSIVAAWVAQQFAGVEVPVEVQGAAAVIIAAVPVPFSRGLDADEDC